MVPAPSPITILPLCSDEKSFLATSLMLPASIPSIAEAKLLASPSALPKASDKLSTSLDTTPVRSTRALSSTAT